MYMGNPGESEVFRMSDRVTFELVFGRDKYRASMLAAIAVVLILGLICGCEENLSSNPQTSVRLSGSDKVSTSASVETNGLSEQIEQLVKNLEYSNKVAEDFAKIVMGWKDTQGRSVLIAWKEKLANANQEHMKGTITENQVAKIQEGVIRELCQRIRNQLSPEEDTFELADVIRNKQANCVGYSQFAYITGYAVGLSVRPIIVWDYSETNKETHIACIINLLGGQVLIADVAIFSDLISEAFKLESQYVKVGNHWELRNKNNPLRIHRKIQLSDRNGLIAGIYLSRGSVHEGKGELELAILNYDKAIDFYPRSAEAHYNRGNVHKMKRAHDRAILDYTKAIEIDLGFAMAYTNRGSAYWDKGEYDQAIADYTKAIEIDPRCAEAYFNRGNVYKAKGEFDRAILDHTKAIEIDSMYTEAYINRGAVYHEKGDYNRAIGDYNKAIEIRPRFAMPYYNRGLAYGAMSKHARAILDYTKAIEIDPRFAMAHINRGNAYLFERNYDQAILDYSEAIEINPKHAGAYFARGASYALLKKNTEAQKDLLKTVELDPRLKASVKKVSERHKLNLKLD